MSTHPSKDRASLCLFAFKDRPPLPPAPRRRSLSLQLSRPPRSRTSRQATHRSQHLRRLFRRLPLRLRPQHRARPHSRGHCSGPAQTRTSRTHRLPRPHPPASHPSRATRIHSSLRPDAWREAIRTCFDPPVESHHQRRHLPQIQRRLTPLRNLHPLRNPPRKATNVANSNTKLHPQPHRAFRRHYQTTRPLSPIRSCPT